jgi:hypothetical protein
VVTATVALLVLPPLLRAPKMRQHRRLMNPLPLLVLVLPRGGGGFLMRPFFSIWFAAEQETGEVG